MPEMSITDFDGWTPVEGRMMAKLRDGRPHTREELWGCCYNGEREIVLVHVSNLRKKLRGLGYLILNWPLSDGEKGYRLLRDDG